MARNACRMHVYAMLGNERNHGACMPSLKQECFGQVLRHQQPVGTAAIIMSMCCGYSDMLRIHARHRVPAIPCVCVFVGVDARNSYSQGHT